MGLTGTARPPAGLMAPAAISPDAREPRVPDEPTSRTIVTDRRPRGASGGPSAGPASGRPPGADRMEPRVVAAVALGGGLGAPVRHGLARFAEVGSDGFPWGTFAVNVTGSFALGVVLALVVERFPPTRYLRPFVATGFLGSYTTYSTFAVETHLLVDGGNPALAVAYAAASLTAGLAAAWAGLRAARRLPPRRAEPPSPDSPSPDPPVADAGIVGRIGGARP